MPSLNRYQYGAPGTYVNEIPTNDLQISIVPFSRNYILVETDQSVSINPSVGLPYNTPVQILDLVDYRDRIGGSVPSAGPALVSYNAIKGFFRNAGAAELYAVRVKPSAGKRLILDQPIPKEVENPDGTFSTVYAYQITFNEFQLGRVDFDAEGNANHIGVVVDSGTTLAAAAERIIDEVLNDGPISSFVYVRYEKGDNAIEFYPRQVGQPLEVNIETTIVLGDLLGGTVETIKASDDPTNDYPVIAVKDYVYALEVSFDPSVHKPGFVFAPCGFAKFNPKDRQILGQALENLARAQYYNWLGLADSGPRDGRLIKSQYNLTQFDLKNGVYTADSDIDQNLPVFIYETQDFYEVTYNNAGLPNTTEALSTINLPVSFTNLSVPVAGVPLTEGRIIESEGLLYGVKSDFTPMSTPLDIPTLLASNTIEGPLKALVDYVPANLPTASKLEYNLPGGTFADVESYSFDVTLNGNTKTISGTFTGTPTNTDVLNDISTKLLAAFGQNDILVTDESGVLTITNPTGEAFANAAMTHNGVGLTSEIVITPGTVASGFPRLYQGQVVNNQGALSWVKRSFTPTTQNFSPTAQRLNLDQDVPISYYELWIEHNLRSDLIKRAVYNPGGLTSSAREVPWNCKTHADFMRDGLMYTSAGGYLTYEFPYWVDFEGFEVPQSAFRAGIAMKVYRTQGFQTPPAGANYPIAGVIRPNVEITRQHQEASNPLGLNAGRYLPDYGPILWSASTVSRRRPGSLWKWINTSVIRSVVVNSFQGAFDSFVFNVIDTEDEIFRRIRSAGEDIMYRLYRGGALYGGSPLEAYRVICDRSNNPDFDLEEGKISVDVHFIPVSTTEVVVVNITRRKIGSLGQNVGIFDLSTRE